MEIIEEMPGIWTGCPTPIIPAHGGGAKKSHRFEASLSYMGILRGKNLIKVVYSHEISQLESTVS